MKLITALLFTSIFHSCSHSHTKAEIESAMHQYDAVLQSMDADGVSKMFTPNGKLGEAAQGREAIKKFLSGFTNVKVLSQSSTTKSIELKGNSAIQTGMYFQNDVVNGNDTAYLKGTYTAQWKYLPNEGWKIEKIITKPIQ